MGNILGIPGSHSVTKTDIGLGNVDNTSDATKNAAAVTLTNKTLTSPVVNSPTGIVKADVGLGNVDNTSDVNKPVSTAQATAIGLKADITALSSHTVNTSNPHTVTKTQVGLGNCDNTSDANKPVSTAAQAALDLKVNGSLLGPIVRTMGGNAYKNILGIVCSPSLEVQAWDTQGANGGAPAGFTFTRASSATACGPDGALYTAAAGELRHEWDALTGEYKGWLIEPTATRKNKYAAAPSGAESVTVTAAAWTISFWGTGSVALTGAHTTTVAGTGANARTTLTFTPSAGTLTMTPSGTVTNMQLELGATASSPIIGGEGSEVTRAVDSFSLATSAFPFNVGKGAFFLEFVVPPSGSLRGIFTIGTSYGTNFYAASNSGSVIIYGPAGVVLANLAKTAGAVCRVAICWDGSTASCAVDGVSTVTDRACAAPSSVTALMLGILWDGAYPMGSHIKHVMAFPHHLSSAELALLTK